MTYVESPIGPSGWPETTHKERVHAVNMLHKALRVHRQDLRSRKRILIAARPNIQAKITMIEGHIARLEVAIVAHRQSES